MSLPAMKYSTYRGITDGFRGEPLIWVDFLTADGKISTGIYDKKRDRFSPADKKKLTRDLQCRKKSAA
ncbi:MAG: hypothetical protein A2Y94_13825 [Caldithrix sp. RBG_13_44_9]|nr:MAG: hypothetical protein A2Y94_13825 [Caldithrix sp. RBG_13_44_9]